MARHRVIYLVCTLWDYDDVVILALHRMVAAERIALRRRVPKEFDLKTVLESGAMGFPLADEPIQLEAVVAPGAAETLAESAMSADQTLEEQPDGTFVLSATVPWNSQLLAWILGLGDLIEVTGGANRQRWQSQAWR